jgi:16S rRNA (cytosine1402-N4)-methyltransferase
VNSLEGRIKNKNHQNKKCDMHQNQHNKQKHLPVLVDEVLQYLAPKAGESYLDLTAGYGGHAAAVLEKTASPGKAVLVDRDQEAANELELKFGHTGVDLRRQDFLSASEQLLREGRHFDLIMADLGVSSPHLNEARRGFAFTRPGPLDMRMDNSTGITAAEIVNTYDEASLGELIARFGEEPKAKQIARLIADNRPLHTTAELAAIVAKAWPGHRSRIHPATRTFQAVRVAVNDELYQLERSLPIWVALLAPAGRLAVISFHSLEDRIVKQIFAEYGGNRYDATVQLLTHQPIMARPQEIVSNPRARSAKLRAAAKIKT